MNEIAASSTETPTAAGAEKRRSTRLVRAVPIIVVGTDALGQPFRESTSTIMVDCYGCKFQSRNYAPKHSTVMVEIFHAPGWDRRVVHGKVVWVQRPRTHRENYQIAIALEVPGNVWGVAPPPVDWFAHPDDHAPAPIEVSDPGPMDTANFAPTGIDRGLPTGTEAALETLSTSGQTGAEIVESEEHAIGGDVEDLDPAVEEFTFTREHLDGQIHEAIGKTLRTMIERAAEAAVEDLLHDVSDRTAALVEAARRISEETAQEVDAKLRRVLDETAKSLQIELPKPANHKRRRRAGK